jgi:hypothetical protein
MQLSVLSSTHLTGKHVIIWALLMLLLVALYCKRICLSHAWFTENGSNEEGSAN